MTPGDATINHGYASQISIEDDPDMDKTIDHDDKKETHSGQNEKFDDEVLGESYMKPVGLAPEYGGPRPTSREKYMRPVGLSSVYGGPVPDNTNATPQSIEEKLDDDAPGESYMTPVGLAPEYAMVAPMQYLTAYQTDSKPVESLSMCTRLRRIKGSTIRRMLGMCCSVSFFTVIYFIVLFYVLS